MSGVVSFPNGQVEGVVSCLRASRAGGVRAVSADAFPTRGGANTTSTTNTTNSTNTTNTTIDNSSVADAFLSSLLFGCVFFVTSQSTPDELLLRKLTGVELIGVESRSFLLSKKKNSVQTHQLMTT